MTAFQINPSHKTTVLLCSIVCILSVNYITYAPILEFGFLTGWDDAWQVINPYTETWSWDNFRSILTNYSYGGQYSPANQIIYTLIYHFFGYCPGMFHLMCLVLHASNSILVFIILRHILLVNRVETQKSTVISLLIALLFASHPLQVESVAWISASKILVYSFFYLLSIWFYLIYIQKNKWVWYILLTLFFILSFGGKEQAITFPVSLLWVDLALRRNFRGLKVWVEKIPIFLLAGVFAYSTMKSNGLNIGWLEGNNSYPLAHRLVFSCYSFFEYMVKILIPVNLLYLYPFPMLAGEPLPGRFLIYPALLLMIGIGFLKFWKQRPVWLGISWFLILVSLMLHIIPITRPNIVADRYVYLALPGIFFIVVWYFMIILGSKPQWRKIIAGVGLVWMLFLFVSSYQRTQVWSDNHSLKEKIYILLQEGEDKTKTQENEATQ